MSIVINVIQTGTYTCQNISTSQFATLEDGNILSPLLGTANCGSDNIRVNKSHLVVYDALLFSGTLSYLSTTDICVELQVGQLLRM